MKLSVIGAGKLGSSIVKGINLHETNVFTSICITAQNKQSLQQRASCLDVDFRTTNKEAVESADIVLIAVKPYHVSEVLKDIKNYLPPHALIISVAAGMSIEKIESSLSSGTAVIRSMLNTASSLSESATAYCTNDHVTQKQKEDAVALFKYVSGCVFEVPENYLSAVTSLSGSGIAYLYLAIESLIDGAVKSGLPRDIAKPIAIQTVIGAGKMAFSKANHIAELKDDVTTPAGTTIAGLSVLEKGGVRSAFIEAVVEAAKQAENLSK